MLCCQAHPRLNIIDVAFFNQGSLETGGIRATRGKKGVGANCLRSVRQIADGSVAELGGADEGCFGCGQSNHVNVLAEEVGLILEGMLDRLN